MPPLSTEGYVSCVMGEMTILQIPCFDGDTFAYFCYSYVQLLCPLNVAFRDVFPGVGVFLCGSSGMTCEPKFILDINVCFKYKLIVTVVFTLWAVGPRMCSDIIWHAFCQFFMFCAKG